MVDDSLIEGKGDGVLFGGPGDDQLTTFNEATLHGGAGDDSLFTGWDDSLAVAYGGRGNDDFNAARGQTLYGGPGSDYFQLPDPSVIKDLEGIDGYTIMPLVPEPAIA